MSDSNFLYVIVPYYNFNNNDSSEFNLFDFLNQGFDDCVKIVVVEALLPTQKPLINLPDFCEHLKVEVSDKLWLQNNLINYAINNIKNCDYFAWADRDIVFCDKNWARKTLEKLKECDILQPFSDCLYLDSNFSIDLNQKIDLFPTGYGKSTCFKITSFCKHFKLFGCERDPEVFRHTGHVWAANSNFLKKVGGRLFDKCFLGSGDIVLSQAIKQSDGAGVYSKLFQHHYWDYFNNFCSQNIRVDYCDGVILHKYHGSIKNRFYNLRYKPFLEDDDFSFDMNFTYNHHGILCFTEAGRAKYSDFIASYFEARGD